MIRKTGKRNSCHERKFIDCNKKITLLPNWRRYFRYFSDFLLSHYLGFPIVVVDRFWVCSKYLWQGLLINHKLKIQNHTSWHIVAGLDNIGERNPCLKQRITPGIFLKNEINDNRRVPQIDPTVYNLKVNLRLGGANPPFSNAWSQFTWKLENYKWYHNILNATWINTF